MDFKSCVTNVHLVESIAKTPFARYESADPLEDLSRLLLELRQHGTMCTRSRDYLWLFGQVPEAVARIIAERSGLKASERGEFEPYFYSKTPDGRLGSSLLLEAIEGTISYQLSLSGALHVGPWTWLFASDNGGGSAEGVLLRLHVSVTDTGALYTTTNTTLSPLSPVKGLVAVGTDVMLTPSGKRARVVSDTGNSARVMDGEAWRAKVIAVVHSEGGQVRPDTEWLTVQTLASDDAACFAWPAHLCLVDTDRRQSARDAIKAYDWRRYFAASEEERGFKHPLAVAEEWFTGAAERDKALQRSKDALAFEERANEDGPAPMSTLASQDAHVLSTSPPFNQRLADQQAAMSGIYPTPPDGFIPGQIMPSSQQPSSDNVVPATIAHADSSISANDFAMGNDNAQHDTMQQTSSSDPSAFQRQRSDDLFGDMGGEMDFVSGEVGDADFDFFNEGDEAAPVDARTVGEDTEMSEVRPHDLDERPSPELALRSDPVDGPDAAMPVAEAEQITARHGELDTEQCGHEIKEDDLLGGLEEAISAANATQAVPESEVFVSEKPLSPFGIKERLLPPPVPASASSVAQPGPGLRRSSTFDPLNFREGLDLGRKWSAQYGPASDFPGMVPRSPAINISLPAKRKKSRTKPAPDKDAEASGSDSISDDESYETASSSSDSDLPLKTPWETKKRKRSYFDAAMADSEFAALLGDGDDADTERSQHTEEEMHAALNRMLVRADGCAAPELRGFNTAGTRRDTGRGPGVLGRIQDVLQLTKLDLVYIAQLVSEQAASCVPQIIETLDILSEDHDPTTAAATAIHRLANGLLTGLLPEVTRCEVTKLALTREPPSRAVSTAAHTKPGQPRPPQRVDSTALGPDILAVPPPYVRVQRGTSTYEMLPPALDFWETLSLAPTNGPKDVRAFCVFPLNEDLQRLLETFFSELNTTYESCKLGTHQHIRNIDEDNDLDGYEDGLAPIELTDDESADATIRAYSDACVQLGSFLGTIAHLDAEKTFVVYMLNPFPHADALQHLCACFWLLCKAYREMAAKASRSQLRSDAVLQIIPIELVTAPDGLVIIDAKQMAALAKEVYDRCPPSLGSDPDITSALPNYAAPFVELAAPPPKRIAFQLTAEPASDLMHEGSSLHVAYAISRDEKWMTVAWMDTTGRYQSSASFCLRGTTFAEVAAEVWGRTRELLAARDVTWRIFVVGAGEIEESIRRCWRKVIEKPRKQPFSVTLLAADLEPSITLAPPPPNGDDGTLKDGTPGTGFLTPGSTPQATTMTVSPSAGDHNVPPTPAPSDSVATSAESILDAQLVDIADESWGVLFSPSSSMPIAKQSDALAHGALFKRGDAGSEHGKVEAQLPSLGVKLLWTVQVRPTGNIDEGNVKQSEMTLREVLKMYRNLSVLTGTRRLAGGRVCVPMHLLAAVEGARALNGFL